MKNSTHKVLNVIGQGRRMATVAYLFSVDLVTDAEITPIDTNVERWCGCIDSALTKEHYITG
jgi:hypothetical protein